MARLFIGSLAMALVCGQALGQVAAPPETLRPPQPEKPVPRAGPRAEPVPAPVVHEPRPKIDLPGTGPRVDLRPKWTTGDTARYDFEFLNHWVARVPGDDGNKKGGQLYRSEGRLLRRVLAADDKGITLSFVIERLHMQVSSGTEVIHYDSDFGNDPARHNDLTDPVQATVGRIITVRVGNDGKIISIDGNENPPPPAADPNKPDAAPPTPPPQVLQAIIGTPIIRKVWRPLYTLDKKFADSRIGDKWTTEEVTPDPSMGTYSLTLHNELKELTDGIAKIETVVDVDFSPLIGHGVVHAALTSSDVTGALEWDTSKGILKRWSTSQEMKLDAERSGENQKLETKLTTTFKWFDPNAPKEVPKPAADPTKAPEPADPKKTH